MIVVYVFGHVLLLEFSKDVGFSLKNKCLFFNFFSLTTNSFSFPSSSTSFLSSSYSFL